MGSISNKKGTNRRGKETMITESSKENREKCVVVEKRSVVENRK